MTVVTPTQKAGLYECTVYEKSNYGDPHPVVTDGHVWSREVVAETASKARYSYWREVHECWDNIKLMDIRVKSLNRRREVMPDGWPMRMYLCNRIIEVIAKYGRHFLSSNSDRREPEANPFIAQFEVDQCGKLWYIDRYKQRPILVRLDKWRGFSDGGTLRDVIEHMRDHIVEDKPLRLHFAEYWGYGEDMQKVAHEVTALMADVKTEACA